MKVGSSLSGLPAPAHPGSGALSPTPRTAASRRREDRRALRAKAIERSTAPLPRRPSRPTGAQPPRTVAFADCAEVDGQDLLRQGDANGVEVDALFRRFHVARLHRRREPVGREIWGYGVNGP